MHQLYFTKIHKDEARNSAEARSRAMEVLEEAGFSSQGYFNCGKSDWFVVGGRWSNCLAQVSKEIEDEAKSVLSKNNIAHDIESLRINKHLVKDTKIIDELNAIYQKAGQNFFTDTYSYLGNEGDAQVITKELLETLKREYTGIEVFDAYECDETVAEKLSEDSLGDWLVVIDYHN